MDLVHNIRMQTLIVHQHQFADDDLMEEEEDLQTEDNDDTEMGVEV